MTPGEAAALTRFLLGARDQAAIIAAREAATVLLHVPNGNGDSMPDAEKIPQPQR